MTVRQSRPKLDVPERIAQLRSWLRNDRGLTDFDFEPASGDASFRRYFRVTPPGRPSLIAMDAPPDREDCGPFLDVRRRLAATGVHVPALLGEDLGQGFLLLEDLGERLYLPELTPDTADRLYREALDALLLMQGGAPVDGLPPYDGALLRREMRLFPDWLLVRHLGLILDADTQALLDEVFQHLLDAALAQPRVFVHRDYHSRNLLVCEERSPGVIDFQDAVLGPVTYDLVSLLRDCYIAWPAERVDAWAMEYFAQCVRSGVLKSDSEERFLEWFDLMGAQRHLKAAGIFARLKYRDGKDGYLADIPRTLEYIVQVAERRPRLRGLAGLITDRVLPALAA